MNELDKEHIRQIHKSDNAILLHQVIEVTSKNKMVYGTYLDYDNANLVCAYLRENYGSAKAGKTYVVETLRCWGKISW